MKKIIETSSLISNYKYHIQWEITHNCNYRCNYCFLQNDKNIKTNLKFSNRGLLQKTLNFLNNIPIEDNSIDILITGGEPTLHPELLFIIDNLNKISKIKSYKLYTNLSLNYVDLIKILDIVDKNKFILSVSYHAKYVDNKVFNQSIEILNYFNIKYHISIMMEQGYENKILMLKYKNVNYQPLENYEDQNYSKHMIDIELKNKISLNDYYYILQDENNIYKEIYTEYQMKKLPLFYHSFKGMNCYKYNHLRINPYGNITYRCNYNNILNFNEKNIYDKLDKVFICDKEYCVTRDDIRCIKKFQ